MHESAFDCPDALIYHKNRLWGLIVHDGGGSYIMFKYCPWCGTRLSK